MPVKQIFFCILCSYWLTGCDFQANAMHLPLIIDVQGNNMCVYTNNKRTFLDESDINSKYFIYIINLGDNDEKKIQYDFTIGKNKFPVEKKDCLLLSIDTLKLNQPYDFYISTEKLFTLRACILREGNNYRIKKVHSTENCDE